jgi:hypothetical protein
VGPGPAVLDFLSAIDVWSRNWLPGIKPEKFWRLPLKIRPQTAISGLETPVFGVLAAFHTEYYFNKRRLCLRVSDAPGVRSMPASGLWRSGDRLNFFMLNGKRILVVMPAYNAAKTLEQTYREVPKDFVDEVILVDDGSHDATAKVAAELGLTTFMHRQNLGYGRNQKTCYREALRAARTS